MNLLKKFYILLLIFYFLFIELYQAERYETARNYSGYAPGRETLGVQDYIYWSTNLNWRLHEDAYLSTQLQNNNEVRSLIDNAYTQWDNVTNNFTKNYYGITTNTYGNDGQNVHYWVTDLNDPIYNVLGEPGPPAPSGAAVTYITVNGTREIVDADVIYDGYYRTGWDDGGYYDIWGIAMHEIGHSIGLHHSDDVDAVMYNDDSHPRYLTESDDIAGAKFLFDHEIIESQTLPIPIWVTTLNFPWDISIPNSVTVTINSGTNIDFDNSSSIIVTGYLQINGTSNDHVVFDFDSPNSGTLNGIKISSGGTIIATYTDIQNAYRGIYINESYGTVNNCTFEDCSTGLYLYRTNFTASGRQPNLNYNTVFKNTYNGDNTGIYCSYSSPDMTNNEVYNYYTGIGVIYNSSPSLGYSSAEGKNNLHDNYKNLHAINSSNPFLGSTSYQGKNKLEDELNLNILAQTNCNITAEQNWWGSDDSSTIASTISTSTSTVDFVPFLVNSPFRPLPPPTLEYTLSKTYLGVEELFKAQEYIIGKEYEKSLEIIRNYKSSEDLNEALFAMDLILQLNRAMTEDGLSFDENSELNSFKELNKNKIVDGFIDLYLTGKLENNRMATLENVKNNYASETEVTIAALYTEFMIYFNELNDYEGAKNVLKLAFNKNPDHPLVESATELLEDIYPNIRFELPKSSVPGEDITSPITDYTLFSNYPNPFNPQTTISYYIPEISQVKVEIIDINGSIIKTFNEGTQQAGHFTILWDGTNSNDRNVASGIYLYRISAISTETGKRFIDSKKMILLR